MLRFLPPYILEKAHVDTAMHALDETLGSLSEPQMEAAALTGGRIGD